MQCPNCCAPLHGDTCEYCGSTFIITNDEPAKTHKATYTRPASSFQTTNDGPQSDKSRLLVLIFCCVLGWVGVHRFYAGKIASGVAYVLTFGLFGFGIMVDFILILLGKFTDKQGLPILKWDM